MNATLELSCAVSSDFTMRQEDGWKHFAAPLQVSGSPVPSHETLLAWNAGLGGGAKFVLAPDLSVELCAELPGEPAPAESDLDLAAETANGIAAGRRLWIAPPAARALPDFPATIAPPTELLDACSQSGWIVAQRNDTAGLAAELAGSDSSWPARVLPIRGGALLLVVELVALEAASPASTVAVARFLLLAGGLLRRARPTFRADCGTVAGCFEVLLPSIPSPGLLADALSALAVGCQRFGREAIELRHDSIARVYLDVTAR
jgi:hypothetical protein